MLWDLRTGVRRAAAEHTQYLTSWGARQKDTEHHTEGDASWESHSWNPSFPPLILQVDLEGKGRLDPARQRPEAEGQRCAHVVDLLIIGKLETNKTVIVWTQQKLSDS